MSSLGYIGRQTPAARSLAGITQYLYDDRGLLRTALPADGDVAIVEGLGLFQYFVGSTENDDDETCFATAAGRWLLILVSWEFVDAMNIAAEYVTLSEEQTLTNKTITAPTITAPTITGTKETRVALSANNIDLTTGNYFTKTISGATSLTVSNVPSTGTVASLILDITNAGGNITWWTGVKWADGIIPSLTASGRDVLGFFTHDGGTTWTGLVLSKDVK